MELSPGILTEERVERAVRGILNDPAAGVLAWDCLPIAYANVGLDSRGLFRLSGAAKTVTGKGEWSVVLKALRPLADGSSSSVHSPHYWKREALAYRSSLFDSLPAGVRVPRFLYYEETEDGTLLLWMEEAVSDTPAPWPLKRFRLAARHLALLNGHFLRPPASLQYAWLSRGMTRIWAEENAYTIGLIEQAENWERPSVSRAFRPSVRARLLRLWAKRELFFERLESLPSTLCHHDAGHRNLFAGTDAQGLPFTLFIDWELIGIGALGEDLGGLFGPALINFEVDARDAEELAAVLLDGYQEGLRAADWSGNSTTMWLAFAISAIFRWLFPAAGWSLAIATDSTGRAEQQTLAQWGQPMEQVYEQWSGLTSYLLDLADQIERVL